VADDAEGPAAVYLFLVLLVHGTEILSNIEASKFTRSNEAL
jgi:hypothetical protein